jgi:hypothetical protein
MVGCLHGFASCLRPPLSALVVTIADVFLTDFLARPIVFVLGDRSGIIETCFSIMRWMDCSPALARCRYRMGGHFPDPAVDDIVFSVYGFCALTRRWSR